jgi:hypothetical protein
MIRWTIVYKTAEGFGVARQKLTCAVYVVATACRVRRGIVVVCLVVLRSSTLAAYAVETARLASIASRCATGSRIFGAALASLFKSKVNSLQVVKVSAISFLFQMGVGKPIAA